MILFISTYANLLPPNSGRPLFDVAVSARKQTAVRKQTRRPEKGLVIATRGGFNRPGPGSWIPNGDPAAQHNLAFILLVYFLRKG
jgi:hypothetical protein